MNWNGKESSGVSDYSYFVGHSQPNFKMYMKADAAQEQVYMQYPSPLLYGGLVSGERPALGTCSHWLLEGMASAVTSKLCTCFRSPAGFSDTRLCILLSSASNNSSLKPCY